MQKTIKLPKSRTFCLSLITGLLAFFSNSFAQQNPLAELSGQNPFRLKWYEISDSFFRVIYPAGSEKIAQHVLNTLHTAKKPVSKSLDAKVRPLNVVIQGLNTDNNGFVTSGARRAEFYNTPPQNPSGLGLNDWFEELCVHEFRHVVQLDNAKQGWGKGLYYLFGNTGLTMAEGITNPWWFWEGDAVGCETVFGFGGRGRLPAFDATLRMQLISGERYAYNRAVCGSMKRFVSNHYVLGYYMTSYVKNHNGIYAWDSILALSYHRFPLPFTFSYCTKKYTGLSLKEVYTNMTNELRDSALKREIKMQPVKSRTVYEPRTKFFTQYRFPCFLPDGSIVAMKSGLGDGGLVAYKSSALDFDKLVWLHKDSTEEVLCTTGVLDDNGRMGCNGKAVVWTETTYDPRWGARNYTDICMYDIARKKRIRVTRKQRLHAPDISPDGSAIAAVEWNVKSECFIVLVDPKSGEITKRFPNPKNTFCLQPKFSEDGSQLVFLKSRPGAKSIWRLNLSTGEESMVMGWVPENIATPNLWKNYITFNSPVYGVDNIFAMDTTTKKVMLVTSQRFGAYHASFSFDGKEIAFHDLTIKGARIRVMPLDPTLWKSISSTDFLPKIAYYSGYIHEEGGNILTHIPKDSFPVKKFNRLKNIINIYGWGFQLTSSSPDIRFGFNSQDLLSTTKIDGGVLWERNEKTFGKYASVQYLGFYPVLGLSYTDGGRHDFYSFKGTKYVVDSSGHYHFQNTELSVSFPFNFSSGRFLRKMNFGSTFFHTEISTVAFPSWEYVTKARTGFHGVQTFFNYQVTLRQAIRDVAPRLGYGIQALYQQTLFPSEIQGKQFAADGQVLLPGIGKHHALRLRGMYQQNGQNNYYFKNAFFFVRGAQNALCNELWIGTFEYKFPLVFPDLNIFGLLYVQRAKTTLFTDIGKGYLALTQVGQAKSQQEFRSVGIEETFDTNILRFLIPVNAGFRASYDMMRKAYSFQFIFGVVGY